jgi:hypothetical protein
MSSGHDGVLGELQRWQSLFFHHSQLNWETATVADLFGKEKDFQQLLLDL